MKVQSKYFFKFLFLVCGVIFFHGCSHSSKNTAATTPNNESARTPAAAQEPVSQDTYRVLDEIKTDMESTLQKGQKSLRK